MSEYDTQLEDTRSSIKDWTMDLNAVSQEDSLYLLGLNEEQALHWIEMNRKEPFNSVMRLSKSATSISSLPNELLLEIFRWIQHFSESNEWLVLTWICQHWRVIALGAPGLWTKIKFHGNAALLATCLRLSRELAIDLNLIDPKEHDVEVSTQPTQNFMDCWESIVTHAGRIRTLNLAWNTVSNPFIDIFFTPTTPLPNLETLRICGTLNDDTMVFSRKSLAYPRLHTLHLTACYISDDVKLFAGVLHLHLNKMKTGYRYIHEKLNSLLDMLCGCPQLESLELMGVQPHIWGGLMHSYVDTLDPSRKVSMPRLLSLRFHLVESTFILLLRHLDFPSLVNVHVRLWSETQEFLQYFRSHFRRSPLLPAKFQSLKLYITDLLVLDDVDLLLDDLSSEDEEFGLHIIDAMNRNPLIAEYLRTVPNVFPSLTRLSFAGDMIWVDTSSWRGTLRRLPNLTTIHVQDVRPKSRTAHCSRNLNGLNDYTDSLSPFFTALSTDPSVPMICPKLEELAIVVNYEIARTLIKLVLALDERKMHDFPLKRLTLVETENAVPVERAILSELRSSVHSLIYETPRRSPVSVATGESPNITKPLLPKILQEDEPDWIWEF